MSTGTEHRVGLSLIAEPLVRWTCVSHHCQRFEGNSKNWP